MQVSQKRIERTIEIMGGVLRIYREKIAQAFLKAEGAMTVNLGVRYKPVEGKMEIEASIKFVTDQVNDSFETMFDENQADLFAKVDDLADEFLAGPGKWFAMPDCRIDAYKPVKVRPAGCADQAYYIRVKLAARLPRACRVPNPCPAPRFKSSSRADEYAHSCKTHH